MMPNSHHLLFLLFLTLSFALTSSSLKILVISPVFGRSHSQFMGNLADIYVKAGHDVVYFEPEIIDNDPVLKFNSSKLARVVRKQKDWTQDTHAFANFQGESGWSIDPIGISDVFESMSAFTGAIASSCDSILNDEPLMESLRAEKFDIGIAEFIAICPYGIYEKIGVKKFITASATPIGAKFGSVFGMPAIPSLAYVPEFFGVQKVDGKMGFFNRLNSIIIYHMGNFVFNRLFIEGPMKPINKHFPDMRAEVRMAQSSYVFINANDHIEFTRPMPLKFINIAGIGVPKPTDLPKDYQQILDNAKNGVVLVSFGSIAQSKNMPPHLKQAFLDTFNEFKDIQFIWKYENASENVAEGYSNVVTKEWVPQVSLFNHKNLIGFVTHGGMNSLIEASVFGIPTVCIAVFGDQTRNCIMTEKRGLGMSVEKLSLNKEVLTNAIHKLVRDKKYLNQAREVGRMISKQPMTPEQRVLKYTQFAAEFDLSTNLDDDGRQLNSVEFYSLDVFAFIFFASLILLFVLVKLAIFVCKLIGRLLTRLGKSKTE